MSKKMRYVLITAARNEEGYIEAAIAAVLRQTVRPARWVIVSDGSSDGTDQIVARQARRHRFITLVRQTDQAGRSFASQAHGLNRAAALLAGVNWDCIGCLDADITLEPDYYERVLAAFAEDADLGVAGGAIHERGPRGFRPRRGNSPRSVAGAVQMFRRSCFETVGPFVPLPNGGLDTVAEIRARMAGYRVATLPFLPVYHHRPTGGGARPLAAARKAGLMDYEIGYHPLYELGACLRRVASGVPVLGAVVRMLAYAGARITGRPRLVDQQLIDHLRWEQRARLRRLVTAGRAAVL